MLIFGKNKYSRGDTLIEVLVSITVFSAVAIGSLSIMNQGAAVAQRALEITLVRQEIDAQAETLRFLNASYISAYRSNVSNYAGTPAEQWRLIRANNTAAAASAFGGNVSTCTTPQAKSFVLNTRKATVMATASNLKLAQTYSQVTYNAADQVVEAQGIWVEAISYSTALANETTAGYIDFHIRACWNSLGQSTPMTLGTIVRLYEPIGDTMSPVAPTPAPVVPPAPPAPITFTTVGTAIWTVPAGVTSVKLEAWGGSGGCAGIQGNGGYAVGNKTVAPGQVLNVYVGGQGGGSFAAAAFNGGGVGSACGGGGASDIRLTGTNLANRIIVAGGGGGGAAWGGLGGAGGGLNGSNGFSITAGNAGLGGTQIAGGAAGTGVAGGGSQTAGSLGQGGQSTLSVFVANGGGGGGYYGGGGGSGTFADDGGGGGGSSYITGLASSSTTAGINVGSGKVVITPL